jgi:hypothetical protein
VSNYDLRSSEASAVATSDHQIYVGASSQPVSQRIPYLIGTHRLAAMGHLDRHPGFLGGIHLPTLLGTLLKLRIAGHVRSTLERRR